MALQTTQSTATTNPWLRTAMRVSGWPTPYSPPTVQAPNINQSYAALGRAGGYRPASGPAPSSQPVTGMVAGPPAQQPAQQQPSGGMTTLPYVDWKTAGYGPGPYAPTPYQPGTPIEQGNTATGKAAGPKQQQLALWQSSRLGPDLSSLLGLQGNQPMTYADLPFMQMQLAYQTQMQQEEDARRVYENLARAYMGVGQSQESLMAKDRLSEMLSGGGPYTPELMDTLRGNIRNQTAISGRGILRQAEEDFGRRGLSGSMTEYELASLGQQQAAGMQSNLSALEQEAATANQAAVQQLIAELQQIAAAEDAQRLQYQMALAEYATPERQAPDLAPFMALADLKSKKARRAVGK